MALSRGQKIGIAVVVLLLLAALALLLLRQTQQAPETVNVPAPSEQGGTAALPSSGGAAGGTVTDITPAPKPQPQPQPAQPAVTVDERADARRLAMAFVERYGSFSNTADYSNLLDLKPLMTSGLASKTDAYVAAQKERSAVNAEFYGVTTRALSVQFQLFDKDGGIAKATVTTQRRESLADGTASLFYQDAALVMKLADGVWKTDSVDWGEKRNY